MTDMTDPFQSESSKQGRRFEEVVEFTLKAAGWKIVSLGDRRFDIEIDIIAISPTGIEHWIECKGSHRGRVPGMRRSDTVRKALFSAYHLSGFEHPPYVVVTSHMPQREGAMTAWIAAALNRGVLAAVWKVSDIENGIEVTA